MAVPRTLVFSQRVSGPPVWVRFLLTESESVSLRRQVKASLHSVPSEAKTARGSSSSSKRADSVKESNSLVLSTLRMVPGARSASLLVISWIASVFCPLKDHTENGAHFKRVDRIKVPQPIKSTLRVKVCVFLIASRPP